MGRSRPAITLALQGTLAAATLDGGRVDAAHPVLVAFARKHWGVGPDVLTAGTTSQPAAGEEAPPRVASTRRTAPEVKSAGVKSTASTPSGDQENVDLASLVDCTVREITDRFGSTQAAADLVALRKQIAHVVRLEMANEERLNTLILREYVATNVFSHIDRTNRLLLRDAAVTIAITVAGRARSNASNEELIKIARDIISQHLVYLKTQTIRALGDAPEEGGDAEHRTT